MTDPSSTALDAQVRAILDALPFEWIAVTDEFRVLATSEHADEFGLADDGTLGHRGVRRLITRALREGTSDEADLELKSPTLRGVQRFVRVRTCAVGPAICAVLLEDVSQSLRVDAMRRDFIVNISHELKTPVGALVLLAEAVKSSADDDDAQQRFIDRILTEAQRLSRLVNDLGDLSRLQGSEEPMRRDSVPVQRMVSEAIDTVKLPAQARDIDFITGSFKGMRVLGDEQQLVTALRNLLTNAISYSPEGTRVSVSGRVVPGFVEISVTDQGIGIEESDVERIFERFYRVDPARSRATGGTGLGLAIVKHICAAHGGECTVWSKPGEGSTFTLRLPSAR